MKFVHGLEHSKFGYSLGVMHLVSKAFRSAIANSPEFLSMEKKDWYEQILRLIALLHDVGHAPFSHGSESVLPNGVEHEDYTEKIIKETCIVEKSELITPFILLQMYNYILKDFIC